MLWLYIYFTGIPIRHMVLISTIDANLAITHLTVELEVLSKAFFERGVGVWLSYVEMHLFMVGIKMGLIIHRMC